MRRGYHLVLTYKINDRLRKETFKYRNRKEAVQAGENYMLGQSTILCNSYAIATLLQKEIVREALARGM